MPEGAAPRSQPRFEPAEHERELTGPVLIIIGDVVAEGTIGSVPVALSELAA